jgi:hypothetical protein
LDGKLGRDVNLFTIQSSSTNFGGKFGSLYNLFPPQYRVFSVRGNSGNSLKLFPEQFNISNLQGNFSRLDKQLKTQFNTLKFDNDTNGVIEIRFKQFEEQYKNWIDSGNSGSISNSLLEQFKFTKF